MEMIRSCRIFTTNRRTEGSRKLCQMSADHPGETHARGLRFGGFMSQQRLARAGVRKALELAAMHAVATVAWPAGMSGSWVQRAPAGMPATD